MVASFAFAVSGSVSGVTSEMRASVGGFGGDGSREGSLKAWQRSFWSVRWEKVVSRRRVRTWLKGGESMRSDVSSRRRRRGGGEEGGVAGRGDVGGEGRVVDATVGSVAGDGMGEGIVPDSRRTVDSWEGGGRR